MNKHTGRWNEWSAQTLLEQCVLRGVKHAVICPGSRSTSLAVAASATPGLKRTIHFDERGAGFYALGLAKSTREPVVVITTSGTAVANLLPAAVEAAQSRVPLLFLTADRPPELRRCGSNQTIDQVNLFGKYAVYFSDILCSDADIPLTFFKKQVDAALLAAQCPGGEGAAHLNLMFREPFLSDSTSSGAKRTSVSPLSISRKTHLQSEDQATLLAALEKAEQGLLVIGSLTHPSDRDAAKAFARKLGWPCVADVTSGLRFSTGIPTLLPHMDLLLCHEKLKWQKPDVVLWLGGPFVSKRLLEWIGKDESCHLIRINQDQVLQDPLHRSNVYLKQSVESVWTQMSETIPSGQSGDWSSLWKQIHQSLANLLAQGDLLGGGRIREADVAKLITDLDVPEYQLFIGNSLAIREVDQVGHVHDAIKAVGVNRGASGIDGLIATASGYAQGAKRPTLALLGDLSALHDINSLALAQKVEAPLVIVVLNNRGGGIFQFLPVKEQTENFEALFITPHDIQFEPLAKSFGLNYSRIKDISTLKAALETALAEPKCHLIEVETDREENLRNHQDLVAELNRLPLG